MKKFLAWVSTLVVVLAAAALVWFSFHYGRHAEGDEESLGKNASTEPASGSSLSHNEQGQAVLKLNDEKIRLAGIESAALQPATLSPTVEAYGVVEEDPSDTFALHATGAGVIAADAAHPWPRLGETLKAGAAVGYVEARLAPLDRSDRELRLAESQANLREQTSAVAASEAAYNRLKALNEKDKNVSDRAVEDAAAKLEADRAHLGSAQESIKLLSGVLSTTQPAPRVPLVVDRGGQVIELGAQPGENVDVNQLILRTSARRHFLVRVSLAVGERPSDRPAAAQIFVAGRHDAPLEGEWVSPVPPRESHAAGPTLLYRISSPPFALSPDEAVTAEVPAAGEAQHGVVVPRAAVVRMLGKAWVYVEESAGAYVRREAATNHPTADGLFQSDAFRPGEKVVTRCAQALLTEELKLSYQPERAD